MAPIEYEAFFEVEERRHVGRIERQGDSIPHVQAVEQQSLHRGMGQNNETRLVGKRQDSKKG